MTSFLFVILELLLGGGKYLYGTLYPLSHNRVPYVLTGWYESTCMKQFNLWNCPTKGCPIHILYRNHPHYTSVYLYYCKPRSSRCMVDKSFVRAKRRGGNIIWPAINYRVVIIVVFTVGHSKRHDRDGVRCSRDVHPLKCIMYSNNIVHLFISGTYNKPGTY